MISASQRAQILEKLQSLAASMGEPAPREILVVPTTRDAAARLCSHGVTNDASGRPDATGVFLVQACGSFTSRRAPPRVPSPTGTVLRFTLITGTDHLLDWGIGPNQLSQAQMETLGPVSALET